MSRFFFALFFLIQVTAYYPHFSCTDSTPNVTASGYKITKKDSGKIIALSRDLAKKYKYGQKFILYTENNLFIVEFQDLMNKRWKKKADILLSSKKDCRNFGVQYGFLIELSR